MTELTGGATAILCAVADDAANTATFGVGVDGAADTGAFDVVAGGAAISRVFDVPVDTIVVCSNVGGAAVTTDRFCCRLVSTTDNADGDVSFSSVIAASPEHASSWKWTYWQK